MTDHSPRGLIMLAATPVGNAGDASARLVDALATSDVIAAEDTRRLRSLLSRLDVEPRGQIVSFYEGNESARVPELIARAAAGARVLVVTDAGMPSISDPGFRLVREAHESDVDITCLPGPSAALAALVLSGLPVARFAFEGFLPRKDGDRRRRLASLATEDRTMVFFEAPHRLDVSVRDMADAFGADRRAAVCRELTKTYEEVKRDSLGELARWAEGEVRGEITIVVAGASDDERRYASGLGDDEAIAAAVRKRMESGLSRKEAAAEVADRAGLSKRYVYDVSLRTVDDT
ncbi:MAG: 16S rRNA (cytidine(1402)-2'-O)-methyltransferase [Candidatus Nanopelagicales bacterium]|nr:16S rRNA (cytidine(1402)-2'-O)-methyltransferase [Candidatus Nanopelagicales bacterium]MCH1462665.1 16S rRNA (cytidine(1402)-2'-O)-methyltransferase [Candidatus Nanopelagicales bacterium]